MNYIKLGLTSLEVSPIVLGGNVFGWTLDEKESFEILDNWFEMGFNTIDTANIYSRWANGNQGGESERIIGNWMKSRGNRNKVNIITKVGGDMGHGKNLTRSNILDAVEGSLNRLQTDRIDLYLSHFDDENTPVEETLQAYDALIKAGKVSFVGASNYSANRLKASLDASRNQSLPRYQVYQPEYNLFDREGFETEEANLCKDEKVAVISYYSLASGFLTGKYRSKSDKDKSVRGGKMDKYMNERGFKILNSLDKISINHNVSQAAVALAWLIENPLVAAPIASATKAHHLKAFEEAVNLNLFKEDLETLNEASQYARVAVG
jgi:aryl-alcohol dehydrogenase-like predicted oxidoreductase